MGVGDSKLEEGIHQWTEDNRNGAERVWPRDHGSESLRESAATFIHVTS